MQSVPKPSLYEQLMSLPENLTGEILNGQLYAHPRPAGRHIRAETVLDRKIGRGYDEGDGGPGGWWILVEPEIHFLLKEDVAVPDITGWQRERMPNIPDDHIFQVIPDWVCEIASPSTESYDRKVKMPTYARYGVPYAWLVDPLAHTLEAFSLQGDEWALLGSFKESDQVCVAPFAAIVISLVDLWI